MSQHGWRGGVMKSPPSNTIKEKDKDTDKRLPQRKKFVVKKTPLSFQPRWGL